MDLSLFLESGGLWNLKADEKFDSKRMPNEIKVFVIWHPFTLFIIFPALLQGYDGGGPHQGQEGGHPRAKVLP